MFLKDNEANLTKSTLPSSPSIPTEASDNHPYAWPIPTLVLDSIVALNVL